MDAMSVNEIIKLVVFSIGISINILFRTLVLVLNLPKGYCINAKRFEWKFSYFWSGLIDLPYILAY